MLRSMSHWLYDIAPNAVRLLKLSIFFSFHSQPPLSALHISTCVCVCVCKLNVFKGWGGGHQFRREDLAVAFLPLASLLRSFPNPISRCQASVPWDLTAPISRRRFKPLSWHPDRAWREGMWRASAPPETQTHLLFCFAQRGTGVLRRAPCALTRSQCRKPH